MYVYNIRPIVKSDDSDHTKLRDQLADTTGQRCAIVNGGASSSCLRSTDGALEDIEIGQVCVECEARCISNSLRNVLRNVHGMFL